MNLILPMGQGVGSKLNIFVLAVPRFFVEQI